MGGRFIWRGGDGVAEVPMAVGAAMIRVGVVLTVVVLVTAVSSPSTWGFGGHATTIYGRLY